MDIIDRIDQLLIERGMTAKSFAAGIGVSTGNVSDWRKRRAKPNSETLSRISEFFGVSADYFLGTQKKAAPEEEQPAVFEKLFSTIEDFSVEEAAKVLEYALYVMHQRTQEPSPPQQQ